MLAEGISGQNPLSRLLGCSTLGVLLLALLLGLLPLVLLVFLSLLLLLLGLVSGDLFFGFLLSLIHGVFMNAGNLSWTQFVALLAVGVTGEAHHQKHHGENTRDHACNDGIAGSFINMGHIVHRETLIVNTGVDLITEALRLINIGNLERPHIFKRISRRCRHLIMTFDRDHIKADGGNHVAIFIRIGHHTCAA